MNRSYKSTPNLQNFLRVLCYPATNINIRRLVTLSPPAIPTKIAPQATLSKCNVTPIWFSNNKVLLRVNVLPSKHLIIAVENDRPLVETVIQFRDELSLMQGTCSAWVKFAQDSNGPAWRVRKNMHSTPLFLQSYSNMQLLNGFLALEFRFPASNNVVEFSVCRNHIIAEYWNSKNQIERWRSQLIPLQENIRSTERIAAALSSSLVRLLGMYLLLQLSTMVWLTYELGWDIMEPVSYLLGSATTIVAYGFCMLLKREYTWRHTELVLSRFIEHKLKTKLQQDLVLSKELCHKVSNQSAILTRVKACL